MTFGEAIFGEAPFGEPGAGDVLVSGEVAVCAATALSGSALTAISIAGEVVTVTTVALDGTAASGPISINGETAVVAVTALDGSAQTQILIGGDLASLSAHANDGTLLIGPVPGSVAVVSLTALDGGVAFDSVTDTANTLDGRSRGGLGVVTLTVPVTPPASDSPTSVNKALPLPLPALVKGRET